MQIADDSSQHLTHGGILAELHDTLSNVDLSTPEDMRCADSMRERLLQLHGHAASACVISQQQQEGEFCLLFGNSCVQKKSLKKKRRQENVDSVHI